MEDLDFEIEMDISRWQASKLQNGSPGSGRPLCASQIVYPIRPNSCKLSGSLDSSDASQKSDELSNTKDALADLQRLLGTKSVLTTEDRGQMLLVLRWHRTFWEDVLHLALMTLTGGVRMPGGGGGGLGVGWGQLIRGGRGVRNGRNLELQNLAQQKCAHGI